MDRSVKHRETVGIHKAMVKGFIYKLIMKEDVTDLSNIWN